LLNNSAQNSNKNIKTSSPTTIIKFLFVSVMNQQKVPTDDDDDDNDDDKFCKKRTYFKLQREW